MSPYAPRKACSCNGCPSCQGRCPETTTGGRCPGCKGEVKRTPEQRDRKSIYNHPRWKALRRQVRRESPWCEHPECHRPWVDLHHDPELADLIAQGLDPYSREFVHPLCREHHSHVTMRDTRHGRKVK